MTDPESSTSLPVVVKRPQGASETVTHSAQIPGLWKDLLDNPRWTDVTFVVGSDKQHFTAHKLVLCIRSPAFESLFKRHSPESNILLPKVNPSAFEILLRYLYCGTIDIEEKMVTSLLELAFQYQLPTLIDVCENFLIKHVRPRYIFLIVRTAIEFLVFATRFQRIQVVQSLLDYIRSNFDKVSVARNFYSISERLFEEIIKTHQVKTSEVTIFKAIIGWAHHQLSLQSPQKEPSQISSTSPSPSTSSSPLPSSPILLNGSSSSIPSIAPVIPHHTDDSGDVESSILVKENAARLLGHIRLGMMTPQEIIKVVYPTHIYPIEHLFVVLAHHHAPLEFPLPVVSFVQSSIMFDEDKMSREMNLTNKNRTVTMGGNKSAGSVVLSQFPIALDQETKIKLRIDTLHQPDYIGIGLSSADISLKHIYCNTKSDRWLVLFSQKNSSRLFGPLVDGIPYSKPLQQGDIITLSVIPSVSQDPTPEPQVSSSSDLSTTLNEIRFIRNEDDCGVAFRNVPGIWYFAVFLYYCGDSVTVLES